MENDQEIYRLELKTDLEAVRQQAEWGGLRAGMRAADIGCGSGKTTSILKQLVATEGEVVGVDSSEERIMHAQSNYGEPGLTFANRDVLEDLGDLGTFDFIWVRFLLEYYKDNSSIILKNLSHILKPGGVLCLIDLDHNSLSHYGLSPRLERTLYAARKLLEERTNFDFDAGRKLYSHMYDLGFSEIQVKIDSHHLIYGELKNNDAYNWFKKIEVASRNVKMEFVEYEGGYEEFVEEFNEYFTSPRRFAYSPLIMCKGRKP